MPIIDGPDFGSPNYDEASPVAYDSSQISDRGQGFSILDNLGRLLFFDDFKNGVSAWQLSQSGSGVVPGVVFPVSNNGLTFSAPCVCDLATVAAFGASQIRKNWMDLDLNKIGVEVCFYNQPGNPDLLIQIFREYNLLSWNSVLRVSPVNGTVAIFDEFGVFQTIENVPEVAAQVSSMWTQVKFVVDPNTRSYVRGNLAGRFYDLSKTRMSETNIAVPAFDINVTVSASAPDASHKTDLMLAYVLITRNEP